MYVARSRQVPPENAFTKRAREKAEAQAAREAAEKAAETSKIAEPAEVADRMPDLQALREAAEAAAALVHAVPFDLNPDAADYTQAPDLNTFIASVTPEGARSTGVEPEEPPARRGRKPTPEVQARTAQVLIAVMEAGQTGISKPDIAAKLGEKEQQVYTSLRQLQKEGRVDVTHIDAVGYRWFAA